MLHECEHPVALITKSALIERDIDSERAMNRVREMRGGKDYDSSFASRMHGEGVWADLIRQRFEKTIERLGMNRRDNRFRLLDASRFRRPTFVAPVPAKKENPTGQLDLF